jgi:galactokinase
MRVVARAPGRVNLIGDHTDYTGGLCFPMAIDRSVVVSGERQESLASVALDSAGLVAADVPLDVGRVAEVSPVWARYVAAVVAELRPAQGFRGTVESTVPQGAGLSSSAALEVAVALALGADLADRLALARLCQAAEHAATGVPTGLLDQLASIGGVAGCGLLLDCRSLTIDPVALPEVDEVQWIVVHTGSRSLAASQYSTRVDELARAARVIGPIRDATLDDLGRLDDATLRARVRHVVTENSRVEAFAVAVADGDVTAAGELMSESHRSLSGDYESSTPEIDELCRRLDGTAGVLGSRITGGGWGGCVVAIVRPGAVDPSDFATAWAVQPAAGASVEHD